MVELFIERERNRGVVGNIYKGRVSKVLPGMQSAFVDIGLERDGFLYVTDVVSTSDQFEQLEAERRRAADPGRDRAASAKKRRRPRRRERPKATGTAGRPDHRPAPQGRAGGAGPGRQGAARHQGRADHLPRVDPRALPRVHADGGSRRRLAQDRLARRAWTSARHRPPVPGAARLHGRHHHPHRRVGAAGGRHPRRPQRLPADLAGDPAARRVRRRRRRSSIASRASSPSCSGIC